MLNQLLPIAPLLLTQSRSEARLVCCVKGADDKTKIEGVLHSWMMTHLTATTTDVATCGNEDRCYLTACCMPANAIDYTSKQIGNRSTHVLIFYALELERDDQWTQ